MLASRYEISPNIPGQFQYECLKVLLAMRRPLAGPGPLRPLCEGLQAAVRVKSATQRLVVHASPATMRPTHINTNESCVVDRPSLCEVRGKGQNVGKQRRCVVEPQPYLDTYLPASLSTLIPQ